MPNHKVASREEWLEARKALLAHEKEETRLRDRNAAERLALPWVKVDKAYAFDTPSGRKTLAELFDGRSQLVVYHFMLPPEWEAGCPGCSFLADHLDGTLPHLNHHDVTLIAVSRAPLAKIDAYKARMGWKFPWASSFENDFNYDFGVSFTPQTIAAGATYNFEPVGEDAGESPGMSETNRPALISPVRAPECYALAYSDPIADATADMAGDTGRGFHIGKDREKQPIGDGRRVEEGELVGHRHILSRFQSLRHGSAPPFSKSRNSRLDCDI